MSTLIKIEVILNSFDRSQEVEEDLKDILSNSYFLGRELETLRICSAGHRLGKIADCSNYEHEPETEPAFFSRYYITKTARYGQILATAAALKRSESSLYLTRPQIDLLIESNPELILRDGRKHVFFYRNKYKQILQAYEMYYKGGAVHSEICYMNSNFVWDAGKDPEPLLYLLG